MPPTFAIPPIHKWVIAVKTEIDPGKNPGNPRKTPRNFEKMFIRISSLVQRSGEGPNINTRP